MSIKLDIQHFQWVQGATTWLGFHARSGMAGLMRMT